MNLIGVVVTIGTLIGAAVLFLRDKQERPIDVYKDYEIYLDAMTDYKEMHGEYAKDIGKLMPFIKVPFEINTKRYALSLDGKFLTVSNLGLEESQRIINEIGGDSYINGIYTYLTLRRFNDLSKVKPIAHFTMKPEGKYTTTT